MTSWSYTDCGLSTDALQIRSVEVSPDPPETRNQTVITLKGTVQEVIEEGAYVDVVVKLGLIKLIQKRYDLHEELRQGGAFALVTPAHTSPIPKGDIELRFTPPLPGPTPQAKFSVALRAYTAGDEDLACLDIKLDYMKTPS
ncbi:ML domain-containing protein [Streptomyces sp. NPDC058000]|uniref:ML domain-containing protein n=1 Tax=Streptomyces sp. NPDC058000 TaxID=3346299 RepID=UPI0036EF4C2B